MNFAEGNLLVKVTYILVLALTILLLVACTSDPTPAPTNTQTFTPNPSITSTFTFEPSPTNTSTAPPISKPTKTKIPTATPRRELTPADVRLPWDNDSLLARGISNVTYKPCYVDTETHWHAGDVFMWRLTGEQMIDIVAPVEGEVVYTRMHTDGSGANLMVLTPFFHEGQNVFMQLRHFDRIDVAEGDYILHGQKIGISRAGGATDPGGYNILDMMLYVAKMQQHHYDSTTRKGQAQFFDTAPYHMDDLLEITYKEIARCNGNPR